MHAAPSRIDLDEMRRTLAEHGYDFKKELGRGGFATVVLVRSQRYDMDFAAKVIQHEGPLNGTVEAEITSLRDLAHPNIICLYDWFTNGHQVYLILEYCPNGSLQDILNKNKNLTEPIARSYFRQIVSALSYCHEHGVAHLDIKPANILIDFYGRMKLADFGLSLVCAQNEKIARNAGSLLFCAPEYFTQQGHDPFKADIWALGIVLYNMLLGRLPWTSTTPRGVKQEIIEGVGSFPDMELPQDALHLLMWMLQVDPTARPGIKMVENSKFVQMGSIRTTSLPGLPPLIKATTPDLRAGKSALCFHVDMKRTVCQSSWSSQSPARQYKLLRPGVVKA